MKLNSSYVVFLPPAKSPFIKRSKIPTYIRWYLTIPYHTLPYLTIPYLTLPYVCILVILVVYLSTYLFKHPSQAQAPEPNCPVHQRIKNLTIYLKKKRLLDR